MKEWILGIVSAGILTTLICILLPQGKLAKFIKSIMSLLVFAIVLSPILSLDYQNIFDYSENIFNNVQTYPEQSDYLNYVNNKKIKQLENDCVNIINRLGADSKVKIDFNNINNNLCFKLIKVNITNWELNLNKEHKDIIEQIKIVISDYLKVSKDVIVIYE